MIATVTELVGRDQELAAIGQFLDRHGGALVLEGEPGIGKTALWSTGVVEAESRGYRTLACSPTESEAQLSFAALRDLLADAFAEVEDELSPPQHRALSIALLREDPGTQPPERGTIAAGLLSALRALDSRGPVLVAVDDVQWLDGPSAAVLEFAGRRLEGTTIKILLALRGQTDGQLPLRLERSYADEARQVIRLGPLSLGALHRLLHARLGAFLSRPTLRRVHQVSGGNPFFALELARSLEQNRTELAPGEPLRLPQTLDELVRERIATLPDESRAALVELAARFEPRPSATAFQSTAMRPAIAAGVVTVEGDRISFSHPLLAAAVYGDADPWERRTVHGRLALQATTKEQRARHLALASPTADESIAAAIEEAGGDALAVGAPESAGELFQLAAELTPPEADESWARRAGSAAEAFRRAGDGQRAGELARGAASRLPRGAERARMLAWVADTEHSVELADRALEEGGRDPLARTWAWNARSEAALLTGDARAALAAAKQALEAARSAGDRAMLVRALSHVGFLQCSSGDWEGWELLQEGVELEGRSFETVSYGPKTASGVAHTWRDELVEARTILEGQVALALEHGDEHARAHLLECLALVEWRAGAWRLGRNLVEEAIELGEQMGFPQSGTGSCLLPLFDAHLGEIDGARARATEILELAHSRRQPLLELRVRALLGFLDLSVGDSRAALGHLDGLNELEAKLGVGEPGIYAFHGDELQALVEEGEIQRAEARIAAVEKRGVELDRPRELIAAWRARALFLAAGGDLPGALEWLDRTLDEHLRLPVPFERARTLLVQGATLRRAKQRRRARRVLQAALAEFEQLGASVWCERTREELARIAGRAPAGELTPAERRVATLVAEGRTNREVAAALYLSERTVEGHLSHVYGKLGIRSRAELARMVASKPQLLTRSVQ